MKLFQDSKLLTSGNKGELRKRLDEHNAEAAMGSSSHNVMGVMLGAVEAEGGVAENAYVGVLETEGGAEVDRVERLPVELLR